MTAGGHAGIGKTTQRTVARFGGYGVLPRSARYAGLGPRLVCGSSHPTFAHVAFSWKFAPSLFSKVWAEGSSAVAQTS